jgi:hypothetical protein
MRAFVLTVILAAAVALAACAPVHSPQSARAPSPAIAQDFQPAVEAAPPVQPQSIAELPPAPAAPANLDANGPPLNILKPPR